ncbi:MAG: UDP-N-acetylmuramoyl-L-alanine--D-glutamate ligase [Candidatus Kerfeldbacteria bacterium]|nr:UDP-N-acetylmuramoyl-L-alanine--D-glutamate ligase [Candidatus Kerfeldbacteria bacterium]
MSKPKSVSTPKPVLIFGLGSYTHGSGTAAALYFAKQGVPVIVTDKKTAKQLNPKTLKLLKRYKHIRFTLGKHLQSDVRKAGLIVRNPGVQQHFTKPTTNDVDLFLKAIRLKYQNRVQVVGVTGTRGKSTTTALIGHILKNQLGKWKVHVGGNIGVSPLTFLDQVKPGHVVVLELSSWLLRDMHDAGLNVAVVTNMLRDHMNYYKNMSLYQKDKERIFIGQTKRHLAVLNHHDPRVRSMAKKTKAKIKWFGEHSVSGTKLLGEHNRFNVGAAWQVGKIFKLSDATLTKAIRSFQPLANRLEIVRRYKSRTFVNDTTATTPDATIAALFSFQKKVILIAGGNTKRLSLVALRRLIPHHVQELILLPGNANHEFPPGIEVTTIKQAVQAAWKLSKPGDVILLSPGVTWLPVMNEFERGKQFVHYVKGLH